MAVLAFVTPIEFGIIAATLFYIAYQSREHERFGRFEIMFAFGNLFMLAMLWTIFLSLQSDSNTFANIVFPLFQAVLWLYVIINFIMFFNLLRNFMKDLQENSGKNYLR
jgi:cytochrome c biogenesis protein CcdA